MSSGVKRRSHRTIQTARKASNAPKAELPTEKKKTRLLPPDDRESVWNELIAIDRQYLEMFDRVWYVYMQSKAHLNDDCFPSTLDRLFANRAIPTH